MGRVRGGSKAQTRLGKERLAIIIIPESDLLWALQLP